MISKLATTQAAFRDNKVQYLYSILSLVNH